MAFAQGLKRFGIGPALRVLVAGFCTNAGHFTKGFEQFGLHAGRVVVEVLLRPRRAGLHGPALDRATARFRQHYRADTLNVSSRKTLQLELRKGQWLIVSETTGN